MMHPAHSSSSIAETVRAERMWAGIAALLLCYYGFFAGMVPLSAAADVLLYTAKIGGVAMVISVIVLQTGKPFALAYDGVASLLIGGALVVSGILWLTGGGGFQGFLNIIFGAMFASSGWRNWNVWMQIRSTAMPQARPIHESTSSLSIEPPQPSPRPIDRPQPPSDSLAGRINRHREGESAAPAHDATAAPSDAPQPMHSAPQEVSPPSTKTPDFTLESPASIRPPTPTQPSTESKSANDGTPDTEKIDKPAKSKPESPPPAPPQGFLASFADSDDERDNSI